MPASVETTEDVASPLEAGVRAKGEYRCVSCGYGVTVYRELPRCPMCGSGSWEQLAWSPFSNAASAPLDELPRAREPPRARRAS